jgi:hypothetical protein
MSEIGRVSALAITGGPFFVIVFYSRNAGASVTLSLALPKICIK